VRSKPTKQHKNDDDEDNADTAVTETVGAEAATEAAE
jgi:hypothetical protein